MAAQVVPLLRRFQPSRDWTQRELAEFYRVEGALIQAGLQLETERGLSDEGDPWFVFCRVDNGEVFIHFARIDGQYVAVGAALEQVVQGKDFPTLIQEMLTAQAWVMAKARNSPNVFLHPAALLIALVGGAFFHSGEAKAAEATDHSKPELRRHVLPILIRDTSERPTPALDPVETATILSSVLIGLNGLTAFAPQPAFALSSSVSASAWDPVAPPPASAAPTLSTLIAAPRPPAVAAGDPAAAHTPIELLSQHPSSAPGFGMGLAGPAPIAAATDQIGADLVLTPARNLHIDPPAPMAVTSAGLVQTSDTDAAKVVQSSNILGGVQTQAGPPVFSTPAALAGLIDQGEHVSTPPSPVVVSGDGSPVGAVSAAGPASTPHAPAPLTATDPLVAAAVAHFAAEVSVLDMIFTGHEIILYDGAIFKPLHPGTQLDSVTFNFADGSSISLVGTAAELHDLHLQG
jgi:hypothetical protein